MIALIKISVDKLIVMSFVFLRGILLTDQYAFAQATVHRNHKLNACLVHCFFLIQEKANEKVE